MVKPVSLFWVLVLIVRGLHYGVFAGVTPLIGTGQVGWTEEQVTGLMGRRAIRRRHCRSDDLAAGQGTALAPRSLAL